MSRFIFDFRAFDVAHICVATVTFDVDLVLDQVSCELLKFQELRGSLFAAVEQINQLLDEVVSASQVRISQHLLHYLHELLQRYCLVRIQHKLL